MADVKSPAKSFSMKDAIKKINKACSDGATIISSGNFSSNLKKLSTGSLSFDYPLKGGLPYGCLVSFSGVEHSGKTTASALAMARYQQENPDKICVYVDAENTLLTQGDYLQAMTGIDYSPEHFARYDCTGRSAEEIFQDLIYMQGTDDIGMIIIDSARALISQADLEGNFLKDNGQRASIAKPLGKFIKQMIMYLPKRNNILIIINQVNVEKAAFSTIYTEPCGYALKYFPSVKLRFGTRTFTLGDKTDLSQSKVDEPDGIRLHYAVTKSRIGGLGKEGGYITLRFDKGVDEVFDMLEIALKYDFIQRPNPKTYILNNLLTGEIYTDLATGEELKFGSKDDLTNYLYSHKTFSTSYIQMITEYIAHHKVKLDLLDAGTLSAILDEENAVSPDGMDVRSALEADGVSDDE